MRSPNISISNNITFGKLLEPHKDSYTRRQEKLANQVREFVDNKYPEDKKGRSYTDYYKEEFNLDLFIKTNNDKNAIELYAYDPKEETFDIIKDYKKGIKPKESDFSNFTSYLKDKVDEFYEKILTGAIIGGMFVAATIAGNKKNIENLPIDSQNKIELVDYGMTDMDSTQYLKPFDI